MRTKLERGNSSSFRRASKIVGIVVCFLLCAIDGKTIEIANDKIILEVDNGKGLLSYFLDGQKVRGAELNIVNTTMENAVLEKAADASIIKVVYGKNSTLRFILRSDSPYLELAFDCPAEQENVFLAKFESQIMIVPDTLSDNYIFFMENADENGGRIFPDFHLLAHLLDNGRAMLTCAWLDADNVFSGRLEKAAGKNYDYCRIEFKGRNTLQLGVPSAEGIWHKIQKKNKSLAFEKISWKVPFNAKWLINYNIINRWDKGMFIDESMPIPDAKIVLQKEYFRLMSGLSVIKTDSWDGYEQVNGRFSYPAYIKNGEAFMREMIFAKNEIQVNTGRPQVIYALNSDDKDNNILPIPALSKLLPNDKLLALRHISVGRGHGICSGTADIERIFKDEKQKEEQKKITAILKGMNEFIVFLNERTKEYRDWEADTEKWLSAESTQNPALKPICGKLAESISQIPTLWKKKFPVFKTPEDFSNITKEVAALIDSDLDSEKQENTSNLAGRKLRIMGGTLHHTMGNFRQIVRAARWTTVQRLATTSNYDEAKLLTEFLKRTSSIIRPQHGEEGK
ncbi:MAG: hypothetical protein A2020_16330 [Lentisphaerae bacterium GWF2_45_14]|nr:MAG: hypothetical protein A2020_16330 [Lentisphaerae bacterium GWF2_45_14]